MEPERRLEKEKWLQDAIDHGDVKYIEYSSFDNPIRFEGGGTGDVYRALWRERREREILVALKHISLPNDDYYRQFFTEMKLYIKITDYRHIIKLFGISQDPCNGRYVLVMEYANEGCLRDFLRKNSSKVNWDDRLRIAREIALGLYDLHRHDIAHRDLHSRNVLLHDGKVKIADLGLSKALNETASSKSLLGGIISYLEPKHIDDDAYIRDKRSDIYSFGVLLWEISAGYPPFRTSSSGLQLARQLANGLREKSIIGTPVEYMHLYKTCWQHEPEARPTIDIIIDKLSLMNLEPAYDGIDRNIPDPVLFGKCSLCGEAFTDNYWCMVCEGKMFRKNFNWTSGNDQIDDFIKNSQLNASKHTQYFEWIPVEKLMIGGFAGRGGFASVSYAIWLDGPRDLLDKKKLIRSPNSEVVIRKFTSGEDATSYLLNSLKIHQFCDKTIRCYGVTRIPESLNYAMVIKQANGGDLRSYIQKKFPFGWMERLRILKCTIESIYSIHRAGYSHNDLHPGNLLRDEDTWNNHELNVYVCDLDLCTRCEGDRILSSTKYGILSYIAPEILRGQQYTKASDIYSFGQIMSYLASGKPPYYNVAHDDFLAIEICHGLRPKIITGTPRCYVELMMRCWDANPIRRPNAEDIKHIFMEWYNGFKNQKEFDAADKRAKIRKNVSVDAVDDDDQIQSLYSSRLLRLDFTDLPVPRNQDLKGTFDDEGLYISEAGEFTQCLDCRITGEIVVNLNLNLPHF